MLSKYDLIKFFYNNGSWMINRVRDAVVKQWITEEQYKEITGIPYDESVLSAE